MTKRRWIIGSAAVLGAVVLSSCGSSMGVGGGGGINSLASTTIKTNSTEAVRRAVMDVFGAEGFAAISRTSESATFTKRGGRTADITWGDLGNPNPVMVNPTVTWRQSGAGTVWVGCQVELSQTSTVFGENVKEPLLAGKSAYNGMLRKVKKRVEGGG